MADLQAYFQSISSAIVRQNGSVLSKLLTLNIEKNVPPSPMFIQKLKTIDVVTHCARQYPDQNLAAVVSSVLQSLIFISDKNFEAGTSIHSVPTRN
jgi:hypothetical protein